MEDVTVLIFGLIFTTAGSAGALGIALALVMVKRNQ